MAENVKSVTDSPQVEFEDQPISSPEEDRFGFDPLAKAVANSISNMAAPHGTVLAINGPWGSGKSSIIALVKHHLSSGTETNNLKIVDFNCWWFRGEEALLLAFLRVLYAAMKPAEGSQAKEMITKLGSQLLSTAGPVVGSLSNLALPSSGKFVSEAMAAFGKLISQDETVEQLHRKLVDALKNDSQHYLVVIDDIDRLSPDEALLIFRLVKSVGALPKVFYLLAYDRHLAEKIVAERYPSEGPHYLEKIVQASFNLPEPTNLKEEFLRRLYEIIGEQEFKDQSYFDRLFERLIAPEITTPRDLLRVLNPLQVTWAAIKGEVNPVDFLCLETLRIQRPSLFDALRQNKIRLTLQGTPLSGNPSPEEYAEQYDKMFLASESEESERERLRTGLRRLFPLLQLGWGNTNINMSRQSEWDRQRRACSPKHFDTYFRFALSDDVLSRNEIDKLIACSGDPGFVRQEFRRAAKSARRTDLLLGALITHADEVPEEHIVNLLSSVYSVADGLIGQRESGLDAGADGTVTAHLLDLHRALTLRYDSLEKKSAVLLTVCPAATLGCLVFLARSVYGEHYPSSEEDWSASGITLTTREAADTLKELALRSIREAAAADLLINCPLLDSVLIWWLESADSDEAVRSWVRNAIRDDHAVARLARAFTGVLRDSQLQGQEIATRLSDRVRIPQLERVAALDEFRRCVRRALDGGRLEPDDRGALQAFWNAWQRRETAGAAGDSSS